MTDLGISDEDLCATCARCKYRPGDLSGCTQGWPGWTDLDGYIVVCDFYDEIDEPGLNWDVDNDPADD